MRPLFSKIRFGSDTYINVGSGNHSLSGFVNIGIGRGSDLRWDVRRGLPFADDSVAGIFNENFIEHLSQSEGLFFLRECRRTLQPGGIVRVATLDLDEATRRYSREDWCGNGDTFRMGLEWVQNPCGMLNIAMREGGNKWVYNSEELLRAGQMAGLVPMGRYEWGQSDEPEFNGLEYRNGSKLIMQFRVRTRGDETEHPTVSVLIPAYRSEFLEEALASVQAQSYPANEVIVCDDGVGPDVENLTSCFATAGLPCRYVRNDPPRGPILNYQRCFELASGEYIKFLNDDDVLEPTCLERMVAVLSADPRITLVTSRRTRVDRESRRLPDCPQTRAIVDEDAVLEGNRLIRHVAETRMNIIGEPTTVLFRRRDVAGIAPHLMTFGGAEFQGMGDVALWANLLSRGDAAYLIEPLSRFRIHEAQRQRDPELRIVGLHAWRRFPSYLVRLGLRRGRLPEALLWRPLSGECWRSVKGSRVQILVYRVVNLARNVRRWMVKRATLRHLG